jgi:hypothetical protein
MLANEVAVTLRKINSFRHRYLSRQNFNQLKKAQVFIQTELQPA